TCRSTPSCRTTTATCWHAKESTVMLSPPGPRPSTATATTSIARPSNARFVTRERRSRTDLLFVHLVLAALAGGCAARGVRLPSDTGTPFPDAAAVHASASHACASVMTLSAELGLSGHAGRQRLRGRALAGFAAPDSMRLEGVAPFGAPAF